MEHVSLSIHDYKRKKLCDIYDSHSRAKEQAKDIAQTAELIGGWKEISFTLPYGFRWDYVRNEHLLRVRVGEWEDWYVVNAPKRTNNGRAPTNTIKCSHLSVTLKTKNLYLTFDDETGIGTAEYLVNRALTNTGWTIGRCDTFYERDGVTEKIRSLSSNGKKGTYQLIADICNLFCAYPVYHGDTKTVDILSLDNKLPITEAFVGKNLESLTVEMNSDNLVTRLYVEGEYGDFGYVGIDDVNPTGLTYLLNFDYYRSVGLFTAEHEAALSAYTTDMPAKNAEISAKQSDIDTGENLLNDLWGQIDYVVYTLKNSAIKKKIPGPAVQPENIDIQEGDTVLIFKATGNYREVTAGTGGSISFAANDKYAVKFITQPAGTIGARQVAIETKEKMITTLQADYENETDEQKKEWIADQIEAYQLTIRDIYNGTEDSTGLYEAMRTAVELVVYLDGDRGELAALLNEQEQIESAFASVMGDMLKDGYWSDNNYAAGQEQLLYWDALDRMEQVSKPTVKYTVSLQMLSEVMGYMEKVPDLNAKVRVLDSRMKINDIVYVSKRTVYLDDPRKGSIEFSNEKIPTSGAKNFETVLGKVTQLADLVDQRNTLYERAKAISAKGTLPADRVVGKLDIQEHEIASKRSGWYTDDTGAIVFESILGDSAFKIGGDGFMIADSKTGENWDWRLFGDGYGFSADALASGYLDTDRIESGSVGSGKLGSNVGNELDISRNITIADPEHGLQAQITVNAEQIQSEVTRATAAEGTMSSRITQTAEAITAEVTRATAAEGTMSSRITQTADAITAEVTRATAAETEAYSRITQTADAITAEVARATNAETEAYSRITQTADAITAEVTRATTAEGSLGSRITQTADAINLEVSKKVGNNEIISRINQTAESILIQASKINLSGYVTASQFNALSGSFNNLVSGTTSASKLTASNGNFSNLEITNALTYGGYGDLKKKIINALSSSASGGTITISSTTLDGSAGPSVNFNIADTQYYRNAVASAETDGWNAARAKVAPPSAGTETSFTVDVPSATQGEKQTYTFTIQKGATPGTSGYASVALGQSVVGRISIGDWYSAGYSAGFTAGQTAGEAYGYTQGWNAAEAQYSAASYARKNLNRYGHAELYVKERDTYYPAGNHYWYWSGSDGWDTLYTKS